MNDVGDDLSFEEAFAELQATIEELRGETLTLDRSLSLYERGTLLAAHCNGLLTTAEMRVSQLDSAIVPVGTESDSDW
ncbi:MAG TPA: exodeoxyribonuclease VII small subunit [Chloroflexota bacterium]|nr:exodeoxyribonuclease VII small subunit [Chloroflexota bacterium]